MRLGRIIEELEMYDPEDLVRFSNGASPVYLCSYRGYYDHLAIVEDRGEVVTVGEFLADLRGALGAKFDGYKGGEFTMHEHTPVWVVADPADTSDFQIGSIVECYDPEIVLVLAEVSV